VNRLIVLLNIGVFIMALGCSVETGADNMTINDGSTVKFDYVLTVDGQLVDSSNGKQPLEYTHGQSQIIPGLEKELLGLKAGDEKQVEVLAKDGYGGVSSDAFRTVPKSSLPEDLNPEAGMTLAMKGPNDEAIPVKITEATEDSIVIDLNHPLAGKNLNFKVNIVSVE
jgi:FKBP-type peptidyl-prolyl cis-trans isomerase 2